MLASARCFYIYLIIRHPGGACQYLRSLAGWHGQHLAVDGTLFLIMAKAIARWAQRG
jgi:hypothetical protein